MKNWKNHAGGFRPVRRTTSLLLVAACLFQTAGVNAAASSNAFPGLLSALTTNDRPRLEVTLLVAACLAWFVLIAVYAWKLRQRQKKIQTEIDERTNELASANKRLQDEIKVREQVEADLKQAHDVLEVRVNERTTELANANQKLRDEMAGRIQAEDRIREQAALLDLVPDAIYVRELDSRLGYWNTGAELMFGWTAEEARGIGVEQMYHPDDLPLLANLQSRIMETGQWSGELRLRGKSGRELAVHSRWKLIRDRNGAPKSILIINTDLTEHKKAQAQYQRARRLESISAVTGAIAHDLNNALAPIAIGVDLLREHSTDPAIEQLLERIETSVSRGADMVRQMLTFSKGEETDFTLIQTRHAIENALTVMRAAFPSGIQINEAINEDLWPIYGNASNLQQILTSLCDNAREAMPQGGALAIKTANVEFDDKFLQANPEARPGPHVMIEVVDTGIGMTPEIQEKIFDPFFTTKTTGHGCGLGLSTALGLVKNHAGFIHVDSKPGSGTVMRVYLPASPGSTPGEVPAEKIENSDQLPHGSNELILLVEDEPLVRDITREILERFNYRVVTANNGVEALKCYSERKTEIQAVLTDLAMPMMDGVSTIRALQRVNSEIKFITMTGAGSQMRAAEIRSLGVSTSLEKPFKASVLLEALQKVLHPATTNPAAPKS